MEHEFKAGDPCVCMSGVFTWKNGNNRYVVPARGLVTYLKNTQEIAFIQYGPSNEKFTTKITNLLPKVSSIDMKDLHPGTKFWVNGERRKYMGRDKEGLHKFYSDTLALITFDDAGIWLNDIKPFPF